MSDQVTDDDPLISHRVFEVGTRMSGLAGCDRELFMLLVLSCVLIVWVEPQIWKGMVAGALFLVGVYLLRAMYKYDPQMREVFLRYNRVPDRLAARAGYLAPRRQQTRKQ